MVGRVRQSVESDWCVEPEKRIQAHDRSCLLTGGIRRISRNGGSDRGSKLKMATENPRMPVANPQCTSAAQGYQEPKGKVAARTRAELRF